MESPPLPAVPSVQPTPLLAQTTATISAPSTGTTFQRSEPGLPCMAFPPFIPWMDTGPGTNQ